MCKAGLRLQDPLGAFVCKASASVPVWLREARTGTRGWGKPPGCAWRGFRQNLAFGHMMGRQGRGGGLLSQADCCCRIAYGKNLCIFPENPEVQIFLSNLIFKVGNECTHAILTT